jgi:hypothetical protein
MTNKLSALSNLIDKFVEGIEPDEILGRLGLERRSSPLTSLLAPLGALGVGLAAGAFADDVLKGVGLRPSKSMVPTVLAGMGLIATGAIVGAGLGVALAPTSGREFRQMAGKRIDELKQRLVPPRGNENNAAEPGILTGPSAEPVARNHAV